MLTAVLSGFVLALAAPWVARLGRPAGWLLAILPLGLTLYFLKQLPAVAAGETVRFARPWVPALEVDLSFHLDGLSLLFALLICGIGTAIVVFAGGYLAGHRQIGRFFAFLLMFMGSMLGLVLADNVVTLFVFWELTSLSSFLLIGFDHGSPAARRAALQALVVTAGGGLALLVGLLLMAGIGGSLELSVLLGRGDILREHRWYTVILLLVLAGAFTKSAQFPLHFWLPNAMAAPTPVSAYLHSATMVKAGVYLLARLSPALGDTFLWTVLLTAFGGITLLVGGLLAIRQLDLKLMLAHTTVGSLGLLVMMLGIGEPKALQAAMLYLLAHALFKGALFMVAGALDHETGTRDLGQLGGLARAMPMTAAAATLAALSMAGLPPFFGFIAKEFVKGGALLSPAAGLAATTVVVGSALMIAVAALIALKPFHGRHRETPKQPHEAPVELWLGPMLLAFLGLGFGVALGTAGDRLVAPAVTAVAGAAVARELHLWEGVTPALILSLAALALGALLAWRWRAAQRAMAKLLRKIGWGPDRGYDQAMAALLRVAAAVTGAVQTGKLRHYMLASFGTVAVALAGGIAWIGGLDLAPPAPEGGLPDLRLPEWAVMALIAAGGLATLFARSRLAAVAALGVVGYGVALLFLLFGAPDLSFTQFMVETLAVVIIMLMLLRLPAAWPARRQPARLLDAAVAIPLGSVVGALVWVVSSGPLDTLLSDYFTAQSYPSGHGRNIVNVIIVDFRALDTLGEIAVVMTAALAAFALIRLRARQP
jgi:multicomponent Na+:H+ antiporter subunit A